MNQPEPQSMPFPILMSEIKKGAIKIPQFQRDFVWNKEKSAKLLDSILKGYPIGTFILWKTRESLRTVRDLGDFRLPDTPVGDSVQYVLDGQQRLTSLFASVEGLSIDREERTDDFSEMFVDLSASEDQELVITDPGGRNPRSLVRITQLLNADLAFLADYPKEYHERLSRYKGAIQSYPFSVILVREAPIDVATQIFTRINVQVQPLSTFQIMVAKMFDAKRGFDLAEEYDKLLETLEGVDYGTVPESTILQAVSAVIAKDCTGKQILKLDRAQFIDVWPKAVDAMCAAVEYFRNCYRIPVSRLLPYNALLVPFTYFFYHHSDRPAGDTHRFLQDFFWRVALGGHYSHSLESRLGQDIQRVDKILAGELPSYDYPVDVSPGFIRKNGWFSTSRSYIKAILCLLAYQEPKSFDGHSIVRISNDWLKQANSKNYHHFFPAAYLQKQDRVYSDINHIGNITIVDDFLNKREIRDKRPSVYMRRFDRENSELDRTMKTHLIKPDSFGVWDDDYDTFIDKRCRTIARELAKRVIPQQIDDIGQETITDDYDVEAEA